MFIRVNIINLNLLFLKQKQKLTWSPKINLEKLMIQKVEKGKEGEVERLLFHVFVFCFILFLIWNDSSHIQSYNILILLYILLLLFLFLLILMIRFYFVPYRPWREKREKAIGKVCMMYVRIIISCNTSYSKIMDNLMYVVWFFYQKIQINKNPTKVGVQIRNPKM